MAKSTKSAVNTPELSGVVTVVGLKNPYIAGKDYQMDAKHAKIIIEKQLVKLK